MSMTTARHNVGGFSAGELAVIRAFRNAAAKRRSGYGVRTPLDDRFWLQVRLEGPDRGGLRRVPPLEVSTSGISYVSTEAVAAGVVATFVMLDRLGLPMTVRGAVMRCRHLGGRMYEVVAAFAREVEIDVFLGEQPGGEEPAPPPEPAQGRSARAHPRAAFDAIFKRIAELTALTPAAGAR
jgi:hypothetical protein